MVLKSKHGNTLGLLPSGFRILTTVFGDASHPQSSELGFPITPPDVASASGHGDARNTGITCQAWRTRHRQRDCWLSRNGQFCRQHLGAKQY